MLRTVSTLAQTFETARPHLAEIYSLRLPKLQPLVVRRGKFQAADAHLDAETLQQARHWHKGLGDVQWPQGVTTFSRSGGPGGQHVNKTQSKATTVWSVEALLTVLPQLLHSHVRSSRYWTAGNDSWAIQSSSQRSKHDNQRANRTKLVEELQKLYATVVPGESSPSKARNFVRIEKNRMRRGQSDNYNH